MTRPRARALEALRIVVLAILSVAALSPVLSNDFVKYDDNDYVTENAHVRRGLTMEGLRWALTTGHASNWHPLTWVSHMADVSMFGLNPSGHHATNLFLHLVDTLLLYRLLRKLTGEPWPGAWVAALFAVHPAHVESVAWIAERKDLLSAAFWFATMLAYVSWVRRRGAGRYLAVVLFFAAGLMSKPMLVSLPFILLLMDYWPLGRAADRKAWPGLVLEKVPLFLLAAASSLVTFLVQRAGGAVRSLESFPPAVRAGNAVVAYVRYLGMLVWPADLAVLYPHPGRSLSLGQILPAGLLFLALCGAAIVFRRKAPWFFVGWFWFVITLVPVIGLVQVGLQARADRYTYIPFVGLFVAIVWGIAALLANRRFPGVAVEAAAAAALLALAVSAHAQARLWKNSETLFVHTLAVTKRNATIHNNLGDYYNDVGRPADALPHLTEAVRLRPKNHEHYSNLGRSLFLLGRFDEAEAYFRRSLELEPGNPTALNNLARTRFVEGEIADAVRYYEATLAQAPNFDEARSRLIVALLMEGKTAKAVTQLERCAASGSEAGKECLRMLDEIPMLERGGDDPAAPSLRGFLAAAHRDASLALQRRGKPDAALVQLRMSVDLLPCSVENRNDFGALLVQRNRLDEAAAEFRTALEIDPGSAVAHNDLGYVLFLQGRPKAAIEHYSEALRLDPDFSLARANLETALRGQPREKGARPTPPAAPSPR